MENNTPQQTYNCDRCGNPFSYDENLMTDFLGIACTIKHYLELIKDNPNVWFCCDPCIEAMPDASHYFESGDVIAVPTFEQN